MPSLRAVVVDANVLIPILSCDFLLTGLDLAVYALVVTPKILDEMERHLLSDFPYQDRDRLAVRAKRVRFALRNGIAQDVSPTTAVDAVNVKDRHVAMAAITGRATIVVTNDRRLRRQLQAALPKVAPMSADEFALDLLERDTAGLTAILNAIAEKRRNPPMTVEELVTRVERGFPKLAAGWGERRSGFSDRSPYE